MTPERLREIERLFHEARERPPTERDAFLASVCADDPTLRREVESLLAQAPAGVVDAPIDALVAALVAPSAPRLAPGSSVGVYRIVGLLDAGGMGEVYRARDTTLDRDVAIKILPRHFTADAERLARFEREARLLATLNHPHVGAIYGIVDADGVRGLVLELIEGFTLADRLASGPLPIAEALQIAHQIAEALEAAHEKGVVHRDLKPANIKITPEGIVKVIDFGLAKTIAADGAGVDGQPPLSVSGATKPGLLLGTIAYMSPEQARGRSVDRRTDVWAFGCVVYEMLAGRNPFDAPTASEAIAKILEREPDWDVLPASVPAAVRRLVQRCLKKDPSNRLHDIADARIEIADALAAPDPEPPESRRDRSAANRRPWIVAAAVVVAAAALLVFVGRNRQQSSAGLLEFKIDLPDNAAFGVAVSPDGRRVAIAACCGGPQISVHSFDTGKTLPVSGTENGSTPFWSPDGSEIGFFAHRQFMRVNSAGGPPVVVCEAGSYSAGTWNADGDVLFSADSRMFRVSASGGARSPIDLADGDAATAARTTPVFLSDGRHFIYHLEGAHGGTVRVGSLGSTDTTYLVDSDHPAAFAPPSQLLYLRGTALMTATIDPTTFALKGPISLVAPDVAPGYLGGPGTLSLFSASANGVLAFVPTRGGSEGRLTWFDRVGKVTGAIEAPPDAEYLNPAISPDGEHIAVNLMDPQTGNWDIWVVDTAGRVLSRLTSDPARDSDPVWSADGKEIAFVSNRGGKWGLYRRTADGSGPEVPIVTFDRPMVDLLLSDWSSDGESLLYTVEVPKLGLSVWKAPVNGGGSPVQLLQGAFGVFGARLSPDGRWIAYGSFETGPPELYVQRLAGGDKRQISHGGGVHPRWSPDSRELVYWAVPGGVTSVELDISGSQLRIGSPKTAIAAPILTLIDSRSQYDVTRDGRRFLLRQPVGTQRPAITVMVNWTDKLKK